ncbi:MAG: LytR/AlgR family response regulator transcription factor [Roseburia sp.]
MAICDDEPNILVQTKAMLQRYGRVKLSVDCFPGGEELLAAEKTYDVILLDIDMKGMSGIDTAKELRRRDRRVKLIYVTNYRDYTIFAFGVHAFAYLLKPLREEELFAQLDEAFAYGLEEEEPELEFMAKEGICRCKPSAILFFEYQNRAVRMHTATGDWHLKRRIAEVAAEMAAYDFVVPHKSFVVNLCAVQNIRGYDIFLNDGSCIPLSQKKSAEFRRSLNCYLAEKGAFHS